MKRTISLYSMLILSMVASITYAQSPAHLYLDLMKNILINSIYQDHGAEATLEVHKIKFVPYNHAHRALGRDWPKLAHTMIGLERLNNIQYCVEEIIKNNIDGDLIETGVWRGGSTIFMRAILHVYNIPDKNVWVADSFQGLPAPNVAEYPADHDCWFNHIKYLSVSLEKVQENFRRYKLLDDKVKFLKGWFKDTIPSAPIEKLSLLRLDGDLYESTIIVLNNLYPKLSVGGFVIVDDYHIPACKQAIADYRSAHGITEPIIDIDGAGVFWKKEQ